MKQYRNLIKPYLVWAFVIIVIPLILIALYAFTEDGNEVLTFSFTLENFRKFLEATYMSVIFKSFKLGILTTLICLGLGYPLAFIISKCPEKSQNLLILLVTIPEWINMLLRTYAWMNLLSDNGIINHFAWITGDFPGDNDVYEFFRCCGHGLQFYAVYDYSDSYLTEKNGQFSH